MIGCFLGDAFHYFFLPILEYHSAVWCLAAGTHFNLLDHVFSGASFFLNWGVLEYDIAVAVLCMLYMTRYNSATFLWCSFCTVCASAGCML